ncbi:MAG: hypothetical protein AAF618_04975 [Pseudomonadota bacterium]
MGDFFDQFHDARRRAAAENRDASGWRVSLQAEAMIRRELPDAPACLPNVRSLFGIPLLIDVDLPKGGVVLLSGDEEIAAFTVN